MVARRVIAVLALGLMTALGARVVSAQSGAGEGNGPASAGCPRMVFYSDVGEEGGSIWSAPSEGGAAMQIWSSPDAARMGDRAGHMSPDCTEVLIEHHEFDVGGKVHRSTILVARVDQFGARELVAPEDADAANPVWAPDGQHIYYIRDYVHPVDSRQEIWRIGRDGSGDTMILNLGEVIGRYNTLLPSPDGSRLLLTVGPNSPDPEEVEATSVWLIDVAQGSVTHIYDGTPQQSGGWAFFSPDGRYVVYQVDFLVQPPEEGFFYESEIRIRDLLTGDDRVVAPRMSRQMWLIYLADNYGYLWSPDGSDFLVTLTADDDPDDDGSYETAIYRVPVDGSGPILVRRPVDCYVEEPGWTADHTRIRFLEDCAFSEPAGPIAIKTILPDGSGETVIPVIVPDEWLRSALLHR